jgi:hypothetical protein
MTTIADVQKSVGIAQLNLGQAQTQLSALAPTPPPPSTMPAPPGYTTKILEDTFSGTILNGQLWNTFYGPGTRWDVHNLGSPYSSGGSNQSAYWAPQQITVNNGLTLSARRTVQGDVGFGKLPWVSGCITSHQPLPSTGWYIQIKAKRPDGTSGMWWADWLLPSSSSQELDGGEGGWPGGNNIMHSDTFAGSGQVQAAYDVGVDTTADYHVYGYQYNPAAGQFFVFFDYKSVYSFRGALSPEAYYLFLQLQVYSGASGQWHTVTTPSTPNPSLLQYAEVQVWTP